MKKIVHACERAPWGYGVAWPDPMNDTYICYPIPINLLVRWGQKLYCRLGKTSSEYGRLVSRIQQLEQRLADMKMELEFGAHSERATREILYIVLKEVGEVVIAPSMTVLSDRDSIVVWTNPATGNTHLKFREYKSNEETK